MATIGPTLEKPEDLRRAIEAGAAWFRLPCGYRQRPHIENARRVRDVAGKAKVPVQLLLDLPSSRPRTGTMMELRLVPGDRVIFWDPEVVPAISASNGTAAVPLPGLAELMDKLVPQQRMWFCDGRLNFVVDKICENEVLTHMVNGTVPLKSSNSLFLPDSPSPFSAITPLDNKLLRSMAEAKVTPDWVALSLIATPQDVREARAEIQAVFGEGVKIMAKFETVAALEAAEEIMEEAEGIMVARGDLGLAVGYIRLPEAQERLIELARRCGKVTVVATQVMEAFAETGLPQRAELSDLSLIARQRADAVMLGKETVYSPRPIECIRLAREVLAYETRRFENASKPRRAGKRPTKSLAQ